MMRVLGLAAFTILAAVTAFADSDRDNFHWQGRMSAGRTLEVKGISGDVRAELATGADAEVWAMKYGSDGSVEQVRVEISELGGGVTVSAHYPRPHPGDRFDVKVDFVVRVPSGVRLVARTVNGAVQASGLESDVEAHTVNGRIDIGTSKSATAETLNGSIVACVGEVAASDGRAFSAVNGSVVLDLPELENAELDVETVNGAIRSEFPLFAGSTKPQRIVKTIGKGGPKLSIRTVNGSVYLLRTV